MADLRSGSALDLCCGVARLTQALAEHFDHVVGVDIAEPMIEQARRFNRHGERATNDCIVDRSLPDAAFLASMSASVPAVVRPGYTTPDTVVTELLARLGGEVVATRFWSREAFDDAAYFVRKR